ncbi:MAG: DUF2924 domain-containing protein [Roseiarcus sp.]|jgi:hypothetical protein
MAASLRRARVEGASAAAEPSKQRSASIEDEIASLRDLTLDDLRRRWRVAAGQSAPARLPRFLLLRMLAYRLQVRAFGDLDKNSIDLLDRIAEAMSSAVPQSKSRGRARSSSIVPPVNPRRLKTGAMLVREWKGVLHRVMILERGFAWNGATYDSLSTIARAITGTEWSGPRFFGLRERKIQEDVSSQGDAAAGKPPGASVNAAAGFRRGHRAAHDSASAL